MRGVVAVLVAIAGCAEQPGACIEYVSQGVNVASSWCLEVERPELCPYHQSQDDWRWEWLPGEACDAVGYPIGCGEEIWEDVASECASR